MVKIYNYDPSKSPKLKVGDISSPVQFQTMDGKDAYRILFLKSRTDPHKANLKQDWDKIQEWALEDKKQQEIGIWIGEKSQNTYIKINEEFDGCVFLNTWASR
jgi:peptidyl-prolyl cis-trans isomerase SurA